MALPGRGDLREWLLIRQMVSRPGRRRPDPSIRRRHLSLAVGRELATCLAILLSLSTGSLPTLAGEPFSGRPAPPLPALPPLEFAEGESAEALRLPTIPPVDHAAAKDADDKLFTVEEIRITGAHSLDRQTLTALAAPYLNRPLRTADLEELRHRISRLYLSLGFINSGAILLTPRPRDGVVVYRMVEGRLVSIVVSGNGGLREEYLIDRLAGEMDEPLNVTALQQRFHRLQQDPLFRQLDAVLLPGARPGEAILKVEAERAAPYALRMGVDNHGSPATGERRLLLEAVIRNLSGWGESWQLNLDGNGSRRELGLQLAWPLSSRGTRFHLAYDRSRSRVVEQPLSELDIDNRFRAAEMGLTHPWRQTLEQTIELGAWLSLKESRNTLLDEPFSFTPGEVDGVSRTMVLRLEQSLTHGTREVAWAAHSSLSFGVDGPGATIHHDGTADGRFVSWLGRLQWARRLALTGGQLIARGDLHLASDRLLPVERFAVGGSESVRGYRNNSQIGDSGYLVSLQYLHPLADHSTVTGRLDIKAFIDAGSAWNRGEERSAPLRSFGAGIQWQPHPAAGLELVVAEALDDQPTGTGDSLQERGVHLRLQIDLL